MHHKPGLTWIKLSNHIVVKFEVFLIGLPQRITACGIGQQTLFDRLVACDIVRNIADVDLWLVGPASKHDQRFVEMFREADKFNSLFEHFDRSVGVRTGAVTLTKTNRFIEIVQLR